MGAVSAGLEGVSALSVVGAGVGCVANAHPSPSQPGNLAVSERLICQGLLQNRDGIPAAANLDALIGSLRAGIAVAGQKSFADPYAAPLPAGGPRLVPDRGQTMPAAVLPVGGALVGPIARGEVGGVHSAIVKPRGKRDFIAGEEFIRHGPPSYANRTAAALSTRTSAWLAISTESQMSVSISAVNVASAVVSPLRAL